MSGKMTAALCAVFFLLAAALVYFPEDPSAAPAHAAVISKDLPDKKEEPQSSMLFPELDVSSVSHLEITASDRSFSFIPNGPDKVSVNGQQGDSEVFTTLVSQIARLPVSPQETFTPQESPLLTVRVSFSGYEHSVRFYRGVGEGDARLIADMQDNPRYGETDAWRVGTLLLACDGTRIQDERGNETPAE